MNILISSKMHHVALSSYVNVAKAFVYAGHDVVVWDGTKPAYDVWDELKPSVFISNEISDTEKTLSEEYGTKHFIANIPIWADVFLYRNIKDISESDIKAFACDRVIIINSNRDEINVVKKYLNTDSELKTKLFSPFQYMYKQYCQGIPENLYSLALSSAGTCIATNFLNFFNFTLANQSTVYPLYDEQAHYSAEEIRNNNTCFHGAKEVSDACGLDIDFMKLYEKFRNENGV